MKLFQVVPGGVQFEKNLDRQKGECWGLCRAILLSIPCAILVTERLLCPGAHLELPSLQDVCCASPGIPRGPTWQLAPSTSSVCLMSAQVMNCPRLGHRSLEQPSGGACGVPYPGAPSAATSLCFGMSAWHCHSSQPGSPAAHRTQGKDKVRSLRSSHSLPILNNPSLPQAEQPRGSW